MNEAVTELRARKFSRKGDGKGKAIETNFRENQAPREGHLSLEAGCFRDQGTKQLSSGCDIYYGDCGEVQLLLALLFFPSVILWSHRDFLSSQC